MHPVTLSILAKQHTDELLTAGRRRSPRSPARKAPDTDRFI